MATAEQQRDTDRRSSRRESDETPLERMNRLLIRLVYFQSVIIAVLAGARLVEMLSAQ